jgi:hypothetical protein
MRSQYDAFAGKGNVDTSQFGVNPFQRVEIIIGAGSNAPDRTTPEFFPQLEGSGFWVERADYPVLCSIVSPATNVDQSFVLRDGDKFMAPFKGLYISHPLLNLLLPNSAPIKLSLILFKGGSTFENSYANPVSRSNLASRVLTNTTTSQSRAVFVPPGVRYLDKLRSIILNTTVDAPPTASFADKNNITAVNIANVTQQILGVTQTYVGNNGQYIAAQVGSKIGSASVFDWPPMIVPGNAAELIVTFVGTGLGSNDLNGIWS